jgi:hypothetical protein
LPIQGSPYFAARRVLGTPLPAGAYSGSKSMKIVLSAIALAFAVTVATPVLAQTKDAPKTKADCAKAKDMKWDDKAGKCVKK